MKKLKTILQHNALYYVVLLMAFFIYFIYSNIDHISVYKSFNNTKLTITNITYYDYGIKLDLKGKEKVIGYIYDDDTKDFKNNYLIGDKVLVTGEVKEINNNTVPNTFNYKKYLNSNKIYNVISITNIKKISSSKKVSYKIKNILLKRNKKLKKSYSYINSLIFGDNAYIENEIKSSYRENGISHLFAISGLHISVFVYLLSKTIDKFKIKRFIKNIIIITFLLFYMFLTNYSMSVQRCSIFTILLIINKTIKLEISSVNLLLLTLSIILFINPLSFNNIGLQYSFIVTFFLLKYNNLIKGTKIMQLFCVSLIAFLVSYPITVNNFFQINVLSVIYNLFFVPYVSIILLPLTLVTYAFPVLDDILYFFIKIIEISSQFLSKVNFAKINMCKIEVYFIMLYFFVVYKLFSKNTNKKTIYIVFILIFFIGNYLSPIKKEKYIMVFDVEQGDSIIINSNYNITLIDTGGLTTFDNKKYEYKISKNKLLPYLKSVGISGINNLILTHGDFDHMGEAINLVNNFKVENVIFNCGAYNDLEVELIKTLNKKKIKYYSCIKELNFDNNKLYFLNNKDYGNENDNSIVLYTEFNNKKFLFMGDASIKTETDIMYKYNLDDIDVIKVGHHGSKTSSSKEFINSINPKYSIISVGKNNRYGHPNSEVLDVLDNSKIYRTDIDGSIMFKIKNNKLDVSTCPP